MLVTLPKFLPKLHRRYPGICQQFLRERNFLMDHEVGKRRFQMTDKYLRQI